MKILVISKNRADNKRMTSHFSGGETTVVGFQTKSIKTSTISAEFIGPRIEAFLGHNPDLILCSKLLQDGPELLLQELKIRTLVKDALIVWL